MVETERGHARLGSPPAGEEEHRRPVAAGHVGQTGCAPQHGRGQHGRAPLLGPAGQPRQAGGQGTRVAGRGQRSAYPSVYDSVMGLHARGFDRLVVAFAAVDGRPATDEVFVRMALAYRDVARSQPALYELMVGAPVMGSCPTTTPGRSPPPPSRRSCARSATGCRRSTPPRPPRRPSPWPARCGLGHPRRGRPRAGRAARPGVDGLVATLVGAVLSTARDDPSRLLSDRPARAARRGRRG